MLFAKIRWTKAVLTKRPDGEEERRGGKRKEERCVLRYVVAGRKRKTTMVR